MADEDRDDQPGQQGEDRPNIGTWAAIAIVAAVVLLAGWVVVTGGDDDDNGGAGGPSSTTTPARSDDDDGEALGEGECPDMPAGDEIPETGPEVDWEIVYGAALPFSEDHGPAVVDGDIARCYSHTPTGALIAALQIEYRVLLARQGVDVVEEQTTAGAGQDVLIDALEERGWSPAQPGELCQTAGFRFVTYTSEEAVIAIAARCAASGNLQLTELRVRWEDGDWRQVLQPDGSSSPTASALADLSGMTPWGGV
jgi:hypothetical protein